MPTLDERAGRIDDAITGSEPAAFKNVTAAETVLALARQGQGTGSAEST